MEKKCSCSTLDACQYCGVVFLLSLVKIYIHTKEFYKYIICPVCKNVIEIPKT